jgi:hypothetical protein
VVQNIVPVRLDRTSLCSWFSDSADDARSICCEHSRCNMAVMSSAEAVGIVCSRMHAQPCQYLIRHSTRLLRCHSIPAAEERGGGEPADGVAGFAALSWSIQRSAYNTVQQGNVPLSLDTSVKVNSARALRLGRRQSWSLSLRFQEKCGEETRSTEGTASSSSPRWTESEIGGRLAQSGARLASAPVRPTRRASSHATRLSRHHLFDRMAHQLECTRKSGRIESSTSASRR